MISLQWPSLKWRCSLVSFRTPASPATQKSASPSPRKSGLAGKPFIYQVRLDFPCKRSGHEGVQDAVEPAWNVFGAVFDQAAEGLRYALLVVHRFHLLGFQLEPGLFEHRLVGKPGLPYGDVTT